MTINVLKLARRSRKGSEFRHGRGKETISPKRDIRAILQLILSIIVFFVSLYIIFIGSFSDNAVKLAFSMLGAVIAFWLTPVG